MSEWIKQGAKQFNSSLAKHVKQDKKFQLGLNKTLPSQTGLAMERINDFIKNINASEQIGRHRWIQLCISRSALVG